MKIYLFLLFSCFTFNSFEQNQTSAFTTENINFNSKGISLAGTIFMPKQCYAAVVMVHGSGQESRMVATASLLALNGIAVLTYDKRGVGKSDGLYVGPEVGTNNIDSANLQLLASDASAAVNTLQARLAIKTPLGLLGFSQAGWVIPLAAKANPKVGFMVIFSGPLLTTLEQLRFQFYTNGNQRFWETHTEAQAREHINSDPDRYQFAPTDPREALAKLAIRGLWLFGGKDIQIPVNLCIERLNALQAQGKRYEYQLFPDLGHNTGSSVDAALKWIRANVH